MKGDDEQKGIRFEARINADFDDVKEVEVRLGNTELQLMVDWNGTWSLYQVYPDPSSEATFFHLPITSGTIPEERLV